MGKIVLAFSKKETSEKVRRMLDGSEYVVSAVCLSFAELMRAIADTEDILIIMGYKLPDATVNEVARNLSDGQELMTIVKSDLREMIDDDIFIVPIPVNRQGLISSIDLLWQGVERRSHRAVRTPEEQKIIEGAKLFLMENHRMTEAQAHRFIQKRSMDTGAKFIDTARMILNI